MYERPFDFQVLGGEGAPSRCHFSYATGFYLVQGHVYVEVREQGNRRNKVPSE